jgi:asparagine synthase (glutamine-hydrolysing)
MCGIAGVLDLDGRTGTPERALLTAMTRAMRHRGPDEFGYYRDRRVGLAHARLSIVDLASGQQPMSNEDGTLWVVFNGEVFNHVELREELAAKGHTFRTRSDTEVIVHAWEQWGEESFARFNGQWAIALWDSVNETLVLCRDRVGVRPIFYEQSGGRLRFASEVKSLFADPAVRRAFDAEGFAETFTFWASRAPRTVYEGVTELPPGTLKVWSRDGSSFERRYWAPAFPTVSPREARTPDARTEAEAAEALRAHLVSATRLRMTRADVPVGSYLSGGIDSSFVARLARDTVSGRLKTFSLRFEDAEYDETSYQRRMVQELGSEHAEVVATRADIAAALPEVVRHAERPLLRTAPAPLFLLSRLVRAEGFKVVLTGEGSDEFLGGYDLFREAKVRRFWARQPGSTLRPKLFDRLYPWLSRSPAQARGLALQFWAKGLDQHASPTFSHGPRWSSAAALQRMFAPEFQRRARPEGAASAVERLEAELPAAFAGWDPLAQAQYLEITTLLAPYILSSQGDRMLMANSIEGRFPFLDAEVMAFANGLPARFKLAVLDEKHLLKVAAKGMIPDEILNRPKQPYRAPDAACFVGADAPSWVADALSERALRDAGVWDPKAATTLYEKCRRRAAAGDLSFSNADNMALVGVLSTQLLHASVLSAPADDAEVSFRTAVDRA